jgi:integrase
METNLTTPHVNGYRIPWNKGKLTG